MSSLLLMGVGASGAAEAAEPTTCAEAGTCDTCTDLKFTDSGWCLSSSEQTLTRTNCSWEVTGSTHYGVLTCITAPDPDVWELRIDDGEFRCYFQKALSTCPAGVYTRTTNDCDGDCGATQTVLSV